MEKQAASNRSFNRAPVVLGGRYLEYFGASIAAALLLQVTIITDTIIVGQLLGPVCMSGIRVASPIVNLLNVIAMLTGVGGSTITAIAMGRRHRKTADAAFTTTIGCLQLPCRSPLEHLGARAVNEAHAMLSVTTLSFDMSVKEVGTPLVNGLRVVLADETQVNDPAKLVELFDRTGADPEMARILTSMLAYARTPNARPVVVPQAGNAFTMQVLYRLGFSWNPTSAEYVEQFLEMLEGLGFFDPEEGQ